MKNIEHFDVIIIGGSYSGLSAALALGRALKRVLIIDSGKPCNIQTPYSHNFITHDGHMPKEITALAKQQVLAYHTVTFYNGLATNAIKMQSGFIVQTESGDILRASKLIFATGINDIMPDIKGFAECWGISVLHCPYCHGYEVRNETTGILGDGKDGFELVKLISNWTNDITLFTNGKTMLANEQIEQLQKLHIKIEENEIEEMEHINGYLQNISFKDGSKKITKAIYTRPPFRQQCSLPEELGCELTENGYLKIDASQKTTVNGVYACGDNTTRMRTVANAVAMGTTAGMMVNNELIEEDFELRIL